MTILELKSEFINIYGGDDKDLKVFQAPGRVNLIGEHTDYNGGYVFPAALSFVNTIIIRKCATSTIKLAVTSLPDRVCADIDKLDSYKNLKWGNYQLGVAYMLQLEGLKIPGCQILYHGTVPYGGGLSSSASIEAVMAIALLSLCNKEMDKKKIAKLCQKAENEYCGMNCGVMDQFASLFGKQDHAILLDCNTLDYRHVPLKLDGYSIVLTNTNKPHSLIESKYNQRRQECESALGCINQIAPEVKNLCSLTPEEFAKYSHLITNDVWLRRARHAVSENARCKEAVTALENNDIAKFGTLMHASHDSLRDDYEVTGTELDTLYNLGKQVDGCVGVRMTGAGFGGCTVAIVKNEKALEYQNYILPKYQQITGYTPSFYVCSIGDGAKEII